MADTQSGSTPPTYLRVEKPSLASSIVIWIAAWIVDAVIAWILSGEEVFLCPDGYTNRTSYYVVVLVFSIPLSGWGLWRIALHVGHQWAIRDVARAVPALAIVAGLIVLGVVVNLVAVADLPATAPCAD
jgi:hypothetical protein